MYIMAVKRAANQYVAHGSNRRSYFLEHLDEFIRDKNGNICPYNITNLPGKIDKKQIWYALVLKLPNDKLSIPLVTNTRFTCKEYLRMLKKQRAEAGNTERIKYSILYLTNNNYEEEIKVEEEKRKECTYTRRSSGEYDIYCGSNHLAVVDNIQELREYFEEPDIADKYYCRDI